MNELPPVTGVPGGLANGQRTPALSDLLRRKWNVLRQFKPNSLATCQGRRQQLEVVSLDAVPEVSLRLELLIVAAASPRAPISLIREA